MNRMPPKRILVPMDLSEPSLAAWAAAGLIARRARAELSVVYVQAPEYVLPPMDPNLGLARLPDLERLEAEHARACVGRLRRVVAGVPRARVGWLRGWPEAALAGLADKRRADLVVMGSHGYHGLDRVLHGSVSEALVRRATAPVLALHASRRPWRPRRVLVPVNLTPHADACLRYAVGLAGLLGARVDALLVSEHRPAETRARLAERLREVLGSLASRVGTLAASGDPREAIVAAARRYDLVALAAHRRRFFRDLVLGSTVERVLRHSPAPVLAVPSAEGGRWREVGISVGGVPAKGFYLPA